jgi:hypothetical protein
MSDELRRVGSALSADRRRPARQGRPYLQPPERRSAVGLARAAPGFKAAFPGP